MLVSKDHALTSCRCGDDTKTWSPVWCGESGGRRLLRVGLMRRFVSTLLLVLLVTALADASAAPDDASSSVDESQLNDGVGSSRTNKTLVVVIGSLRGGELAWRSMYAHLLDLNSADLAITISNDALNATTASLVRRARYVWTHEEYEDWFRKCEDWLRKCEGWFRGEEIEGIPAASHEDAFLV